MGIVNILADYSCGGIENLRFDAMLPNIVSTVVSVIQIGVPILLIIFGMIDLGKAVVASKEDEIKKGQQTFFKRLIAALIVFFVVVIAKLAVSLVSGEDTGAVGCINCFVNGIDSCESA